MYYDDKKSKILRTYFKVLNYDFKSLEAPESYKVKYRLYKWTKGKKGSRLYVFKKQRDAREYAKKHGGLVFACYIKEEEPTLEITHGDAQYFKEFWRTLTRYMRLRRHLSLPKFFAYLTKHKLQFPTYQDPQTIMAKSVKIYRVLQP